MPLTSFQRFGFGLFALLLSPYAWLVAVRSSGPSYDFVTPLFAFVAMGFGVAAVAARGWLRMALVVPAFVSYALALAVWFVDARVTPACPLGDVACREVAIQSVAEHARRPLPLMVVSGLPLGIALLAGACGTGGWRWAHRGIAAVVGIPTLAHLGLAMGVGVHVPVRPPPPPPFVAPSPRGPHVSGVRVEWAERTTSGFVWIEDTDPQRLHRWIGETGDRVVAEADRIDGLRVLGDRVAWVEDGRRAAVAGPDGARTSWEDPQMRIASVVPDAAGGMIVATREVGLGLALRHVADDGTVTHLPATRTGNALVAADATGIWYDESGDHQGIYRLDRASGVSTRMGDLWMGDGWVKDGRVYWWSWEGAEPARVRSRALDGTLPRAHGRWKEVDPDQDGVSGTLDADAHRVTWTDANGRTIETFVVPDRASPFHTRLGPTDVFWWTPEGVGLEPRP